MPFYQQNNKDNKNVFAQMRNRMQPQQQMPLQDKQLQQPQVNQNVGGMPNLPQQQPPPIQNKQPTFGESMAQSSFGAPAEPRPQPRYNTQMVLDLISKNRGK